MKPNPNLDELLSSFVDGELSDRQKTEVQRMAARDPEVGRRLRQLQNCRALFSSLPPAQSPPDLLEQVRQSLERRLLLQEQPVFGRRAAGSWHLVFRKLVSAAAMIALLGILGVVVYQIVGPASNVATPPTAGPVADSTSAQPRFGPEVVAPPALAAQRGFSGRLELQTAALVPAEASLRQAIEDNGLTPFVQVDTSGSRQVYRLVSTREGANRLLASLSGIWSNFSSASLHVERPGDPTVSVVVESVTLEQAVSIVTCNDTEASLRAAESYALMNSLARNIPGQELLVALGEDAGIPSTMMMAPKPQQTANDATSRTTLAPPQGRPDTSLTIVLLGTR
jgi:hypothetical protein